MIDSQCILGEVSPVEFFGFMPMLLNMFGVKISLTDNA